jgi:hypothetical protein
MTKISPFKHTSLHPKTLKRNYEQIKDHDGDLYFNNCKGCVGRQKKISDEDLEEAIRRIDAGELIDREDVRHEMLPDVPSRTVCNTADTILLPINVSFQV